MGPKWETGLREALSKQLGRPLKMILEVAGGLQATPRQLREADQQARQRSAEASIEDDPQLRSLMDHFEAGLIPDSVRPIE